MSFVCFDCRLAVHAVEPSHLHAALVLGRFHQGAAPLPLAAVGRHQERRQTKDAAQRLLPATRHHTRVSFTLFLVNIVPMFTFSYFLVEARTVYLAPICIFLYKLNWKNFEFAYIALYKLQKIDVFSVILFLLFVLNC